jgi:hypothetical protein
MWMVLQLIEQARGRRETDVVGCLNGVREASGKVCRRGAPYGRGRLRGHDLGVLRLRLLLV